MPLADTSALLSGLVQRGYAVCESFVDAEHAAELAGESRALYEAGRFRPAGIGAARDIVPGVRGDEVCWIDTPSAAQSRYITQLAELSVEINGQLLLGLIAVELHLARYAPGQGYARHLDRQHADQARTLSCTLYLNAHWQVGDGGALRLYPADCAFVDVLPRMGTMACFVSDEIEHEVLPCLEPRWSLTAWLLRRTDDALGFVGDRGISFPAPPRGR